MSSIVRKGKVENASQWRKFQKKFDFHKNEIYYLIN